jgi:hypothetical protein
MRPKLRTIVRANEVLGRFLEFIVHAPPGKHETRHTITIRNHSRRWMRALVSLPQPKADAITFSSLKAVKKIAIVFDGHLIVNSTITREIEATATMTARRTNLPQSIWLNQSGLGAW